MQQIFTPPTDHTDTLSAETRSIFRDIYAMHPNGMIFNEYFLADEAFVAELESRLVSEGIEVELPKSYEERVYWLFARLPFDLQIEAYLFMQNLVNEEMLDQNILEQVKTRFLSEYKSAYLELFAEYSKQSKQLVTPEEAAEGDVIEVTRYSVQLVDQVHIKMRVEEVLDGYDEVRIRDRVIKTPRYIKRVKEFKVTGKVERDLYESIMILSVTYSYSFTNKELKFRFPRSFSDLTAFFHERGHMQDMQDLENGELGMLQDASIEFNKMINGKPNNFSAEMKHRLLRAEVAASNYAYNQMKRLATELDIFNEFFDLCLRQELYANYQTYQDRLVSY